MNELREQAMKHVFKVEKLKAQHAELEEFQEALLTPDSPDIEIGIGTTKGRLYRVRLEEDLGIVTIQKELRRKLIAETHIKKEKLENELKKLIGGNE